ncbi:MAG: ShlB/FhaC/HecB family hemolysin secretion/activation protein [Oscillatoriales cyanobacterium C42_A2020_001]|nr:ShlB/FhaC/HecB family hemolysin secretion/activation protein [Leptolyngbyaceae cyanobacterium C42_A2020_001]
MKKTLQLLATCVFWLELAATAIAQTPASPQPSLPQDRPATNPLLPPRPDLEPLPEITPAPLPAPPLQIPPGSTPPISEPVPAPTTSVYVNRVLVQGSTVFSAEELAAVVRPFEKRNLTFEQLLEIRTAVTKLYSDRGHITSGAFLPPQDDLATGTIKIQVVEGELERLEIKGLQRLRDRYVRRRLERAAKTPLNLREIESALRLLQINPLLSSVRAELRAGTAPGRSVLVVDLQEAKAFRAAALLENRDPPSVGSIRGSVIVGHDNLLGLGDRFAAELGLTSGVTELSLEYGVPLNPRDGTWNVRYQRTRSQIVEEPFSVLDINSNSETVSFGFRQPLTRTPTNEFALGLFMDFRRSQSFLFNDIPFSFSPGTDQGEAKVRVLRFTQDWINRGSNRVLAARSQLSFGLPILGATQNEAGIDGTFFSWIGQFQWVQAVNRDITAIARVAAQLTPDSLLPLEQFSLGGIDTVRGFRQNYRVADNGIVGNLEVRFPILQQEDGIGIVQLAPFVDVGKVWNNTDEIPHPQLLASTGLGLRWQLGTTLFARLDWGIPLVSYDRQGSTLQDSGVVFSIRLQFF